MNNQKRKKRAITLIEMIIVMILIATITGAIAYNYRGSLNEGKAFKTKEGMSRIETILAIYFAENSDELQKYQQGDWKKIIQMSPLIKNPDEYIKDGWGKQYDVQVSNDSGNAEIKVHSDEYTKYINSKKK